MAVHWESSQQHHFSHSSGFCFTRISGVVTVPVDSTSTSNCVRHIGSDQSLCGYLSPVQVAIYSTELKDITINEVFSTLSECANSTFIVNDIFSCERKHG